MSFLQPAALLWLLLAVPAIVVLYLLKLKRRDRVVSSVLLWSRLIKDVQANTPFQKLRRSLLLLLQILLVLLISLALGRPFVRMHALGGKSMAIVLDGSASMRATDVPGGRFEEARRLARRMIDGMGRGDAAVLILATGRARAVCPLTGDKNALRRALDSMRPADTGTRLQEAVLLAASLLAQRSDPQVFLLSDGAFARMEDLGGFGAAARLGAAQVRFVRVGRGGDNVGVTALDVRKALAGSFDYQAFAQIRNFSGAEKRFTLEMLRDDTLIDAREVTLGPGKTHGEVLGIQGSAEGALQVRIDIADDLATDNSATVMLLPRRQTRVLLVSPGSLFLEKALSVDPRVSVAKVASGPAAALAAAKYDIVVLDGKAPAGLPARGRYLFIGAGGENAPVEVTGETRGPTFLDWDRRHPVTRFLDLGSVQISRALVARPLAWGQALAESESGPLVVAGEKEGLRSLFVAFSLGESDLPMRVAFPIFLSNAVDWLMGSGGGVASLRARTGDVVPIEVPADARGVQVILPDGARRAQAEGQSPIPFAETEQAGVYRVEGRRGKDPYRARFAVSLASEEESDIRPRETIAIGRTTVAASSSASQSVPREIWRLVALVALALMAFEWYAYHRRL